MRMIDLIIRFENHTNQAKFVATEDISDYFVYNTLAMECFQAVNALIEIGKWIVAEQKLGFPSTYKKIFESIKRLIFLK